MRGSRRHTIKKVTNTPSDSWLTSKSWFLLQNFVVFHTIICMVTLTMSFVCLTREGVSGWMVHAPGSLINNTQGVHIRSFLDYSMLTVRVPLKDKVIFDNTYITMLI